MRNGLLETAAVLVAGLMLVACEPSRGNDGGVDASIDPCPNGICPPGNQDGGADGGTNDGGTNDGGTDGGVWTVTVEDLRGPNVPYGTEVLLEDVVVSDVFNKFQGSQGDWLGEFWVVDPANPDQGIWIRKRYQDLPNQLEVNRGDVLTVHGFFGTESQFTDRSGYRRVVKGENDFLPSNQRPGRPLELTRHSSATPPTELAVTAGTFGDAQGGEERADLDKAGARVHVQGPLELVDPSPQAMTRIHNGEIDGSNGFELTGGILVNNFKTFRSDGGCPWRDVALDAGTQGEKVVFTGGVKGTWESYTHAPCTDGGTVNNCFPRDPGHIPGTDAGFTMVLYPDSCDDFVGGEVQPQ